MLWTAVRGRRNTTSGSTASQPRANKTQGEAEGEQNTQDVQDNPLGRDFALGLAILLERSCARRTFGFGTCHVNSPWKVVVTLCGQLSVISPWSFVRCAVDYTQRPVAWQGLSPRSIDLALLRAYNATVSTGLLPDIIWYRGQAKFQENVWNLTAPRVTIDVSPAVFPS
jgi:hypothetical protein